MELSKRLQAVADFVTPGFTLADVGCDHGYIPIYLTEREICPHVIAMDVNEGPLMRAKQHVLEQPESLPIDLLLSDGLKALSPHQVQSVTIAGMGGALVMKILSDSPEIVKELEECILQPQSELYKVRAFLLQEGFSIIDENMVLEDGKYYPLMKVQPPKEQKEQRENWTPCELQFGRHLLLKQNQVLHQYLLRERQIKEQVLRSIKGKEGDHIEKRIGEISDELQLIKEALGYYRKEEMEC